VNKIKFVEVVKNLKSGKMFILVDSNDSRLQVITPEGKMASLPEKIFDEEPLLLENDQIQVELSGEQITAFEKLSKSDEIEAKNRAEDKELKAAADAAAETRQVASSSGPAKPRAKRKPKADPRTGIAARWKAPRLSFYRNHIDPLGPKQSFIITVNESDQYQMTKAQFESTFNEVVMSKTYIREGLFTYDAIPEKASQYLKKAD
jgi:hypothetical protein